MDKVILNRLQKMGEKTGPDATNDERFILFSQTNVQTDLSD